MIEKSYTGNQIKVLKGLEPVRMRPGMYIGSTSKAGLNHMVYEIVDNGVDEHINGYCTELSVILNADDTVEVLDNGRGIPVDMHPTEKKSTLEVVMTVLHAGGKFDKNAYKVSGGLHGVGASVVNALSEFFEVKVFKDGDVYYQRYQRGVPDEPVKIIDKSDKSGTYIRFKPDTEIFEDEDISVESISIENRLKEIAFLNPNLVINFVDNKKGKKEKFHFSGGLKQFLDYYMKKRKKQLLTDSISITGSYLYKKGEPELQLDLELGYTNSDENTIISFVNNIRTIDGGEHEVGFKTALTRLINEYAKKHNILKEKDENFTGEDVREGMIAILHVKMANPIFEGQTKGKLGSKLARESVNNIMNEFLTIYFDSHIKETKAIIERVKVAQRRRIAAKKARDSVKRKSIFENSTLPGKLADCISRDLNESEIFIVEGDSAGGNAKQARHRNYQAILPLRGKILNAEKKDMIKLLKNEQILNITTALGTGIGEEFDISKLRYGKIIIMTDADVDGAHIRTLILTFFYRYMRELIEEGHVYIAQPPLYKYEVGKESFYLYTDEELEQKKKEYLDKKYKLQRYKGLGEMNPDQLWDTTMDREQRKMLKIKIEDLMMANEAIEILMGDDPSLRRTFIEENAYKIKELDI
ncbi:type IIA DNA topoisomerase subunit B [Oceanotoga sp. DSM 15011]|uniref:DNA topoisomerase (ATP-hydrolyzing) n=1 Tax=Oceanotoga teriensis TaxID=515440 RepID=A0AA45C920_9BACT|nr:MULTISPECIES: DNA topoisomerase subunit B [Oceanotoga]MDO7977147.1 type IIA DNA topoisomerase subunit B [Oceanotoga teriensis]PWJ96582.1 DNA gyrase subunit B [Oceanotoga teriensis]UYP00244.1 type IIA DNA topoisomerase subunit B [Oceanotoga sp. DSM 15011]